MAFTQKIAKSIQATTDLWGFGILRPTIEGDLVLKNLSMKVSEGKCIALVGASGCGKSTVAALLQRLYEPTSGTISVGLNELRATDVHHLCEHIAVVSHSPNLFDGSIRDNIAYGWMGEMGDEGVMHAANVHDFVVSRPQGYHTPVGENASLISGGQALRLQIARALARPCKVLIFDECTSVLDGANQSAVLETIRDVKVGRMTLMDIRKVPVMKMCDQILLVDNGEV
ncbi:hypothetical protein HYDPIDRAFT_111629 [Hydnomerulius pinastri MD-312]|uniref:ABC transporter domain-containing protein n=1 Tax=Hydnomerulius pinastri MD-312 TaxID=994086 RepID=A0A0C9VH50_9AGAM|nr:hypothetical protein HYDPIDRAFT_111629 [Hydnomerulius pinastri MD-312]